MKKLFSVVLLCTMLFGIINIGTINVYAEKEGNYTFTVSEGKATITKFTGTGTHIELPEALGGATVTAIGYMAFPDIDKPTEIFIPDCVVNIDDEAFSDISNLTIKCHINSYAQTYAINHNIALYVIVEVPNWNPPSDIWYYKAVAYYLEKFSHGNISVEEFHPDEKLKRAEFVTTLGLLEDIDKTAYKTSSFSDVKSEMWYFPYVEWAYQNKVTSGIGGGCFGPDDLITREQMAALLFAYSNLKGYETSDRADISAYSDASSISPWAVEAMQWAVKAGLMCGKSSTNLAPLANATRAEFAQVIMNYCMKIAS